MTASSVHDFRVTIEDLNNMGSPTLGARDAIILKNTATHKDVDTRMLLYAENEFAERSMIQRKEERGLGKSMSVSRAEEQEVRQSKKVH